MVNKNKTQSLGMMIGCVLAIVTLCGAVGPSESAGVVTLASTFLYEPDHYGTIYMYESIPSAWEPGDRGAMEDALNGAKDLGFDTVIQTFPLGLLGSGNEDRWLLFLEAAHTVGIDVVAYLYPNYAYTGDPDDPFYYGDLKAFLNVVGDRPALLGYIGLHEPLEPHAGIDSDEMRAFYTEMKDHAPGLKIAHFMGSMAYWDEHRDDWSFSDGMCDICMIWYYPFRYVDGDPVYERDLVLPLVQPNVALVDERDPDAEVWFLGQAFSHSAHWRNLRMPTADEMVDLYLLVMQEPVDGFLWYPWFHTEEMADEGLGDPGMEDQQGAARDAAYVASLEIGKSALFAGNALFSGNSITYTLTFTNNGPHLASNIVITDLMPGDLLNPTVVGSSGTVITPTPGTTFAWMVDPLQAGTVGIITLTSIVDPGLEPETVIANTAEITSPVAHSSATLSSTVTVTVSRVLTVYLPLVMKNR